MQRLDFAKFEGAGNDFLVLEAASEAALGAAAARALCDRHYGVGGDGVLLVLPSDDARARMVVLNADGSRPEMCGNGLRCVALFLAERDGVDRADYVVATDAGPRRASVKRTGERAEVTLGMGRGTPGEPVTFVVLGREVPFQRVSMGNPHAVAFLDGVDEAALDRFAPELSQSVAGGTNVEIVRQRGPREFSVLVWERGVGRTLACGTGAAAVAVAAVTSGLAPYGAELTLALPGGELGLSVEQGTLEVTLRGPARHVFSGQVAR